MDFLKLELPFDWTGRHLGNALFKATCFFAKGLALWGSMEPPEHYPALYFKPVQELWKREAR